MYARMALFEASGPTALEDAQKFVQERFLPEIRKLRGFAGHVALAQRETRRAASIVLFESEEALREGHEHLNAMSPPDDLRDTRRQSVETFEVAISEIGGDATAARLTRLSGPPDRIDESIRFARESILPTAKQLEGWRGVLSLVERPTGVGALITFWESAEAMSASEEQADRLRTQTAEGTNQTIAGIDRFEVVAMEVPAAVGARH